MFNIHTKEMEWAGHKLSLETGEIARQADGAVYVRYGDTCVLCTVAIAHKISDALGFTPLSVHYQEKTFAAGRIPGGFLKRESKPSENEVLISRLIDRSLRPLFAKDFPYEIQVVCTVFSYDPKADPAIAAINGASAALLLSGAPISNAVAGIRVGRKDKTLCINPVGQDLKDSDLDLVIAGTSEGILMVESQVKELCEEDMLNAVEHAHKSLQPVLELIKGFAESAKSSKRHFEDRDAFLPGLRENIEKLFQEKLSALCQEKDRWTRNHALNRLHDEAIEKLGEEFEKDYIIECFQICWRETVRCHILTSKTRLDGRALDQVRPIACEAKYLPRVHGSALFTRGDTQALVAVTIGGKEDSQIVETLEGVSRAPFLLHYNFPPYSVGEVGKVGAPGRREIGHGKLAWRAFQAVLPSREDFPYTLRIVSDITESYGSSSMATVCGSSIALMDAGVPIKSPVSGIAMGLIYDHGKCAILSDISGTEDHLGDMDFKVAGTKHGITALQMDIKIKSLSMDIVKQALEQAKEGRLHILKEMTEQTLNKARDSFSPYAPSVKLMKISVDRIKDLIGPGGKNIKEICETCSVKIDVDEDGSVSIFGQTQDLADKAAARVKALTGSPEIGETYEGKIVKIIDAGAFVKFGFSDDGFIHISEVSPKRLEKVSDAIAVGDHVRVKCIGFDNKGRIKMSVKQADKIPSA